MWIVKWRLAKEHTEYVRGKEMGWKVSRKTKAKSHTGKMRCEDNLQSNTPFKIVQVLPDSCGAHF